MTSVNKRLTQAERLYALLRKRGHTVLEMVQTGISVCPWKRLSEGSHYLRPGEKVVTYKNSDGLTVYRVRRGV